MDPCGPSCTLLGLPWGFPACTLSGYVVIPALGQAQSVPEEGMPGFCSHFIVFHFLSIYGRETAFPFLVVT